MSFHHLAANLTDINSAPTQTADYRPLDPALDVSDPRSKYGRTSSRGGTPVGRGGGNAGRGSGRADFNARATQAPAPARVSQPRDADRRVDLVNDSAAFMRAVGAMRMKPATTKAETNPTTTIEASTKTEIKPTTGVQPSTKTSSTTIFSKWADIGSAGHPDTEEPVTKTSLRSEVADTNADIRQVPTSEFALPPPHRGETESWTDGFPSAHPSDFNSPVVSSHLSNQSNGPSAVAKGNLVGLGIQGFATSMNDDESSSNHNTANDVNLLDLTEDLKELQEPAKNRVALVKSIVVNGYRYILDESALGNASVEVIDATPRPPPESARIEVDLTSSPAKQVTDNKPEQVAATTGNRNAGAQTTPSLAKSIWGDPAPPRGANLFPSGNTPARANRAQVSSPGTFLGVMGPSTEEGLFGFIEAQLTSAGGPESITSTPNFSFSDGRCADRMNTTKSSVDEYGCVGGEFIYPGLASRSLVIDRYELVRLQKVGDSSYGMTPSAQTARPSSQSTPDGSAAPPPRNKSSATSVKSDATTAGAHKRGMSASKYANTSTSAARSGVAVGTLSFDNLSRYHSGNAGQGPPRIEAGYGTQSTNVSRHSAQDENTNPHHANVTSNSTVRPGFRAGSQAPAAPANSSVRTHMGDGQEYKPISSIRRPAGAGYELLQAENAAANARSGNAARAAQQAGLFSPTSSNFPTVEDDGYESEL